MATATLVPPLPTVGIGDFRAMSLAMFVSCAIVGLAPVSLPTAPLPICLYDRLAQCPGLSANGKSWELFLKQQYPLVLEILGLPKDTPAKTMLNIVANRLSHAKRAGLGPAEEAAYVLGVDCGALSQDTAQGTTDTY